MRFLKKFNHEELEIIEESEAFLSTQKELQKELDAIDAGEVEFYDERQLNEALEETIRQYER
jgi:hypothetical protein